MTREATEKNGRSKDAKILKQFTVLEFPSNYAGLVKAIKEDIDAQATVYTLFCTQFDVFTRSKVDNGANIPFLDALKVERRAASFAKRREQINATLLTVTEKMATGTIDMPEFQKQLAECKKNLATVDSDEVEKKEKNKKGNGAADEEKS